MDALPVELLRLIFAYCDRTTVRSLREVNQTLAKIGIEYMLAPKFTVLGYRNDIDRLHNIALHPELRGRVESIVINLSDVDDYDASAWDEYPKIAASRKMLSQFHERADDLREAFLGLPKLSEVEVTFTQCPVDNEVLRDVYGVPSCRRMDRGVACNNLNTLVQSLHGVSLSSFSVDRFPLEILKLPNYRRHWFTHVQSFSSLTRLEITLDPSGLQGPASAVKSINGLGYILQRPKQLRHLKLAFHPYSSPDSKFALSIRDMLNGFTYPELTDLTLVGISCEEEDLKDFLARHGATLRRLRLGGRGLAKPYQVSLGGLHLHEGTFKSLFHGLRTKLKVLERMHLEGIFECEQPLETYNFYPLTDEAWEEVPRPGWVRQSRQTIDCLAFERFVLGDGLYPAANTMDQQVE